MATLVKGHGYGLASTDPSEENKTVVHFKLNDTAFKTLEEFSKIKSARATIQFTGTEGVIRIPSYGNQPERVFRLSLSALPVDNASFDCIEQTSRLGQSRLFSRGTMHSKISVHATDDVFDRTKAKMSQVEEESKKVCTKEIVPSGRHASKKVRNVLALKNLKVSHMGTKSGAGFRHVNPVTGSSQNASRNTSNSSSVSSLAMSSSSNSSVLSQSRHSPTPMSNLPATKHSAISRVLTSSTTKQPSSSINMPSRDRVIHLLALRPYKKPELILRLQKDGIPEKDRNTLGSVLQQVAVLNRDNSYTLAKSAWADVRQDWPLYTEQDRMLLKKNLQQESRVTVTSPAVSPASSNPESPSSSQKRMSDEPEDVSNPNKRKRGPQGDITGTDTKHKSSPTANRENLEGNTDDVNTEKPEYLRKFVQIEDNDQRRQYKLEFNKEYAEYRELHQEVDKVARKFQSLQTQINQAEEGSPDFEMLKKEVLEQYEAQKSDPKFMGKKQRMDYLHQKLSHIKHLIHDFDQRMHAMSGS